MGRASNAWPNGARLRSLPLLPALRLTGVRDRPREELLAAAKAVLAARGLQRRFAYDTLVLGADGALSAVFWTFEPADPGRWATRCSTSLSRAAALRSPSRRLRVTLHNGQQSDVRLALTNQLVTTAYGWTHRTDGQAPSRHGRPRVHSPVAS